MDAFDFVLQQLVQVVAFLRDTEIFGLSLFNWIAGLALGNFVLDIFLGGDSGAD